VSINNQGSQTLVYDFRYPAKGRDFNKISRDVQRPGIYKGLTISYSGNNVFISSGKAYINCLYNGLDNLGIKIDFDSIFTYGTVLPSAFGQNEILYLEYEYAQIDENYAEFKRQALSTWLASPNPNAVIIGELTFDGSNNITGVDYGRKTWGSINADADWTIPDRLVYHDTDTPAKRWRFDGSLLSTGTRDLQFQNFTEDFTRIPVTNGTNTTQIENDLNVVNRLTVGKFDGRVPLGTVVPVAPVFSATANDGTASEPPGIPATGVITDDGWQRADGAIIPSGANASLVGKFTCDLSDDRFLMGSSGITSSPIAVSDGVNLANNRVLLSVDQMPEHDHSGNSGGISVSLAHNHSYTRLLYQVDTDRGTDSSLWSIDNTEDVDTSGVQATGGSDGDLNHSHSISSQGNGSSFDIRPKWLKVIYLQRVR